MSPKLYQHPFYNHLFGFFDTAIPSKRVGYKQDPQTKEIKVTNIPSGIFTFEENVKTFLQEHPEPSWPLDGRLLVAIYYCQLESEYRQKDIDGFSKTVLDSMKGTVYTDDKQVDALYAFKFPSKTGRRHFFVGIKKIQNNEGWFIPPLFDSEPWMDSSITG
jgi:Holliday junction resolvase RusA-like endonuclease